MWHGTKRQAAELVAACARNCACSYNTLGQRSGPSCAPHDGMVHDQKWLDGLLFERYIVRILRREEGLLTS